VAFTSKLAGILTLSQWPQVALVECGWDDARSLSVEALPYTVLLLLAQFTAGVAAVLLFVELRGTFETAFIRACTWMVVSAATLTTITILAIDARPNADSYVLNPDVIDPARAATLALLLFSVAHFFFVRNDDEAFLAQATGATTLGLGIVLLALLASFVRIPTWSIAGPLLILLAGSITMGAFTVAMIWGHWYLVNPRLEEGPLNDLVKLCLVFIAVEAAVVALNAIVPVGKPFDSNALLAVDLPSNPGFWLRVGIGIVFPAVLAFMAYKSSQERSMMSATGLLYIAVGALLAGEAVGRGLLFVTGAPV
jgi:hypothetical protein